MSAASSYFGITTLLPDLGAGCHLADYQRATAPNHQAAGFPTSCDTCHRPTDSSF